MRATPRTAKNAVHPGHWISASRDPALAPGMYPLQSSARRLRSTQEHVSIETRYKMLVVQTRSAQVAGTGEAEVQRDWAKNAKLADLAPAATAAPRPRLLAGPRARRNPGALFFYSKNVFWRGFGNDQIQVFPCALGARVPDVWSPGAANCPGDEIRSSASRPRSGPPGAGSGHRNAFDQPAQMEFQVVPGITARSCTALGIPARQGGSARRRGGHVLGRYPDAPKRFDGHDHARSPTDQLRPSAPQPPGRRARRAPAPTPGTAARTAEPRRAASWTC